MFRRLYWVTEQVDPKGSSRVAGVYTSIPHLLKHGLNWPSGDSRLRLTLTKLDCENDPIGTWCEPNFDGLEDRLREFIVTDEFSPEHCQMLIDALNNHCKAAA